LAFKPVDDVQSKGQIHQIQQQASKAADAVLPFDAVFQTAVDKTQSFEVFGPRERKTGLRNINLTQDDMARMNAAVDKAASRRASVPFGNGKPGFYRERAEPHRDYRDGCGSMKENVFTNIDSAVIVLVFSRAASGWTS